MKILRNGKINIYEYMNIWIYEYINNEQLGKLNPPENLRIAIEKFGWKKKLSLNKIMWCRDVFVFPGILIEILII